jgi:hypothetical protein
MERRLETVEDKSEKNAEDIASVGKKLEKIEEKLKNRSSQDVDAVYEEFREREAKRLNVIMHGVLECDERENNGEKRIEWDMKGIEDIFKVLELNLTREDVKFCRRVGEKSQAPRAMIVGFHTEYARSILLRYTKHLAETEYEDVSIMPDLTKRQRQEEASMNEEANRRNEEELTEDDMAKNLIWKVIGQRGEKRLVKGYNRNAARGGRGRGSGRGYRNARAGRVVRGMRGQITRGGAERGKRVRNSSGSDQEQPPVRKQRGAANRGMTRRGNIATGGNRVDIGVRPRNQENDTEATEASEAEGEATEVVMVEETEEEMPTPSQLVQMAPSGAQLEGEQGPLRL